MPDKPFKINIYDIELTGEAGAGQIPFRNAIENACGETFGNRHREINGKGRRLDNHEEREGCFLLNFATLEFSGPGRTRPQAATVPIGLDPDEFFSQEMAMLYDPEIGLAFVESASGTLGASSIARYFKEFANSDTNYSLVPRLDQDAGARARRHQTIRSVVLRVSVGPITDVDIQSGFGVIKGFGEGYNAGFVDVAIKSQRERGRTLSLANIWNSINPVLGDADENNVTRLIVTGRENDDDPLEVIDLIQHREKRERLLHIDEGSRKVSHTDRWDALIEIHREFLA